MTVESKTMTVNGVSVHYMEAAASQSAPIIFLHGSVGDAKFHWERMFAELAPHYHLYAPDLPGFGASEPLPEMSYTALVEWVNEFYKALGLEQAALVGNAIGGLVARLFAAAHPYAVPALILINGGVLPGKTSGAARLLASVPGVSGLMFDVLSKQGVRSRQAMDWIVTDHKDPDLLTDEMVQTATASAPGLAAVMRMQALDVVPQKRQPLIPTLLLWGTEDTLSPVKAGKRVSAAIPNSEFREIDDTAHTPHIEAPEVVAFQVQSFIDNIGRPKKSAGARAAGRGLGDHSLPDAADDIR